MTVRLGPRMSGRRLRQALGVAVVLLVAAAPVRAQSPDIKVRPFALVAEERLAAQTTFNATLGSAAKAFAGGGVDVVVHRRYFVDFTVSRMSTTGQRAFVSGGTAFPLGIPLRVSLTPIEVTAGYRFAPRWTRVVPYAGAGVGSYAYTESADFAAAGDDVSVRHAGAVLTAGAEVRVARWMAVAVDVHYTRIPGVLGQGGVSKEVGEDNLGGLAGRVRVILGK